MKILVAKFITIKKFITVDRLWLIQLGRSTLVLKEIALVSLKLDPGGLVPRAMDFMVWRKAIVNCWYYQEPTCGEPDIQTIGFLIVISH